MTYPSKSYVSYKPSGIAWLGEVPEHWTSLPGRACYREKKVPNKGLTETTVLSLSYGQIVVKPPEKLHGLVPASFETYQIVEPGDIIVRPTDLQNDWNSLRFGLSSDRGIITSAYMCFCTNAVVTRPYGHLLLHTYDLKKVFYGLGSGLRQNLDWRDFKYLPCIVPPLPEQAAIVRYLDHADRRIQRYISAKQKLITLLEEQKQAIIHRAVTRGLDSDVRLKPSGVEWLGEVPEHWNLVPLKWVSHRSQNGATPPTSESLFYEDGAIPWYGPSSCGTKEEIGAPVRHLSEVAFSKGHARLVRGPALLIVVIGATAGRMALMSDDGSTNQQITAFEISRDLVSPEFILRQLRSAESWLRATTSTATIPILDSGVVARLLCAIPPMEEQEGINRALDSHVSRIDTAIDRARRQIELLREYRTRLIADVVTGKLDVRGAAARLPDEAGALDDAGEEAADDLDAVAKEAEA